VNVRPFFFPPRNRTLADGVGLPPLLALRRLSGSHYRVVMEGAHGKLSPANRNCFNMTLTPMRLCSSPNSFPKIPARPLTPPGWQPFLLRNRNLLPARPPLSPLLELFPLKFSKTCRPRAQKSNLSPSARWVSSKT